MTNSSPRRAVYVSRLPPPGGGIATWTRILFQRGLSGGWEARLVDARLTRRRRSFDPGRLTALELVRTLRILSSLLIELVFHRPAIVHFNVGSFDLGLFRDWVGAVLAGAFRVPVVLHYHGHVALLEDAPGARLQLWVLTRAVRSAAINLVMNEPSLTFLRSRVGSSPTRVVSLPNFFDELELGSAPPKPRDPDTKARVIFVGSLRVAKGAPEVIAVAHRLPEVEFHLFGAVHDEMEAALADAPSNLRVCGEVAPDRLLAELRAAHLLLFPSLVEGFPYAVLEAMALGLPVVATPVGAIPEMIEEGRGGLLRGPDPSALAEAVSQLLRDETQRIEMGRFNQAKCRSLYRFDLGREELLRLYESLIGG